MKQSDVSTHGNTYFLPAIKTATTPSTGGITSATLTASLHIISEDILEAFTGRDSDIVIVRAGQPLRFITDAKMSGAVVYVDDEIAEGLTVSDEGTFTLPAEIANGGFKVRVSGDGIESEELHITAE